MDETEVPLPFFDRETDLNGVTVTLKAIPGPDGEFDSETTVLQVTIPGDGTYAVRRSDYLTVLDQRVHNSGKYSNLDTWDAFCAALRFSKQIEDKVR